MLDREGNVYLSDFGVSASLKKGQKRGTFAGSPCWMAPEVMSRSGHEYSADIWSAGITAIEIAMGDAPYANLPAGKVMLNILNLDPPKLPKGDWSPGFHNIVESCLQK